MSQKGCAPVMLYSADYKASARRNADAKIELSDVPKHPSALCADAKNSLKSDGSIHDGTSTELKVRFALYTYTLEKLSTVKFIHFHRPGGAMVACLTLDQKVAGSNHVQSLFIIHNCVVSKTRASLQLKKK